MRTATPLRPEPVAAPLVPGWRAPWSPLTGRLRHVVELMRERELTLREVAEIEARALATQAPAAPWVLEFFDRVCLGEDGTKELAPSDICEVEALAELLYGLRGPLGLDVERAPWGADWTIEALALRVFVAVPGVGQAPFYEIVPL